MVLNTISKIVITQAPKECAQASNTFGYVSRHFTKKEYQLGELEKEFLIDAISFSHEVGFFEKLFSLCEVGPRDISFSEEQIVAVVRQKRKEILEKSADAVFFVLDEGQGEYSVACIFFSSNQGSIIPGITKTDISRGPHFKGYFPHMLIVPSK